jgi:hypothetical protein
MMIAIHKGESWGSLRLVIAVDRAGFIILFNGPGIEEGRIDVRDLAPALLSLGRLIDASNLVLYGDKQPIKVEAKAISVGSFEVHLEVVTSLWNSLMSLLDAPESEHAKKLLEWLGLLGVPGVRVSLVGLYRFLNGNRPRKVTK